MAKFVKTPDIHTLTAEQRKALQPGQWITASGALGRWCGQKASGTDVAAWQGTARRHPAGQRGYWAALRQYATA